MQTLTSITEILKGEFFITEITPDTNEIEISIGEVSITADLEFNGYVIPADFENNVAAEYVVLSQSIYATSFYDADGDEVELNADDRAEINKWFQEIKLSVQI